MRASAAEPQSSSTALLSVYLLGCLRCRLKPELQHLLPGSIATPVFRCGGAFRSLLRHGPHVRNVGTMSPEPCKWSPVGPFLWSAVAEAVQDEGMPLKEHHRRRIHRDPRLLPKPRLPADVWPRPRRKKCMSPDEAKRLFASTLRTKNRQIRDLLADEEQLARFSLPVWKREQDAAEALNVSVGMLR